MPEPLSTAVVAGYTMALYLANRTGSALSPAARRVQDAACAIVESKEKSISLFGPKATAISEIWEMAAEHAVEGWDGEGALPVSGLAGRNAEALIRALPTDIPMPEFGPEPDGSISADWIYSRTRFISLSIGENDRIPYAWIDGSDRGHAVSRFYATDRFPQRLLDAIRETMSAPHAAIGAA